MLRDTHLRPLASGVLAFLAVLIFHRTFGGLETLQNVRYLIPLKLGMDFTVFATVYMMFLVAVRQVTAIDRHNFLQLMNFGFEFVRHPFREWVKIYR